MWSKSGLTCTLLLKVCAILGNGNRVWEEHSCSAIAGEMSLAPEWKLDVQGAEKERWAISHGWYHVD